MLAAAEVTVVIPAWDTYAGRALAAAEAFAVPDAGGERAGRVIIVDNASAVDIAPLPPGVELLRTGRRLTIGGARNAALPHVRTPWVLFWDADDRLLHGGMLGRLTAATADGVVAVCAGSMGWEPGSGRRTPWPWPRPAVAALATSRWRLALAASVTNPFPTTGPALLQTAAVRDAGGFHEALGYAEDWVLAAALTRRGRIVFLPAPERLYAVGAGSLSAAASAGSYAEALTALRAGVRGDARSPAWLRALLPVITGVHAIKARRWAHGTTTGLGYYRRAARRAADGAGAAAGGTPTP